MRFVDANALILFYTGAHDTVPLNQRKGAAAQALLERVERGEETVATSLSVLYEIVFVLQRRLRVPKAEIRQAIIDLLALPGLKIPNKAMIIRALDLYAQSSLSFVDATIVMEMQSRGITELYSWDSDFDRVPSITRIEPPFP